MSVIKRFEIVRKKEELNKSQFERKLSKSSGYLNMLEKRGSNPGVDVIMQFAKAFPDYSLSWLMTGEGEILNQEQKMNVFNEPSPSYEKETTLLAVRDDIKNDLKEMTAGFMQNFEIISDGVVQTLRGQQKILRFIDKLDAEEIARSGNKLKEFLKEHK